MTNQDIWRIALGQSAVDSGCRPEDFLEETNKIVISKPHPDIAAALTSRLTQEILAAGKVPFYCAAWSNLPSVRNALKCGYKPAWVEITAKESAFVEKMNLGL